MSLTPDSCLFCKIIVGSTDGLINGEGRGDSTGTIPSRKVYEDDLVVAFLDAFPATNGHCLVVPKDHHSQVDTLPSSYGHRCMDVITKLTAAIKKMDKVAGVNLLQNNGTAAGQVIHHVHFHLIPRLEDDGLFKAPGSKGPYDPALGEEHKAFIRGKLESLYGIAPPPKEI